MIELINVYYGESEFDNHYDIVDENTINNGESLGFHDSSELNSWIEINGLKLLLESIKEDAEEISTGMYTMHFEYVDQDNEVGYISKDFLVKVTVNIDVEDVTCESTADKKYDLGEIHSKLMNESNTEDVARVIKSLQKSIG